jgi:hypothetical protein
VIGRTSPAPATTLAQRLDDLAHRLEMLAPSRSNPEGYFLEKNELVHDLRRLAESTDAAPAPARLPHAGHGRP